MGVPWVFVRNCLGRTKHDLLHTNHSYQMILMLGTCRYLHVNLFVCSEGVNVSHVIVYKKSGSSLQHQVTLVRVMTDDLHVGFTFFGFTPAFYFKIMV